MKWKKWLENWDMMSLRIKAPFLEMEWKPQDEDRNAAWELYVELLTRITTQPLPAGQGDEEAALTSVYRLFGLTRNIIRRNGRYCIEFTKIAVVILNQVIRPFTAKWHMLSGLEAFKDPAQCRIFREELAVVQEHLKKYARMLADMAGVEDITSLEDV